MIISIKKLSDLARVPIRGSTFAAGYDLYSAEDYTLKPFERHLFKTDISISIPRGLYGRIAPRSGLAYKDGIDVMAGVIDEDYLGNIGVILINFGSIDKEIKIGDKIAQIIFENYTVAEFKEVNELKSTERGDGGFGSTDQIKIDPSNNIHPFVNIQSNFVDGIPVIKDMLQSGNEKIHTGRAYTEVLNKINTLNNKELKKYEESHKGKTLADIYNKGLTDTPKKRYIDEIKEKIKDTQ